MTTAISPAGSEERTKNPLRPERLRDIVGQPRAKALLERAVESCYELHKPLEHTLFVGASGTGKTTFAHALGNELQVRVFQIEAPVSYDTLMQLRTEMGAGEILQVDEIHMQAVQDRRGRQASILPETFYSVLEDRTIPTQHGVLEYPEITVIGTTTDEGMLPDAFINRFPLRPVLEPYTPEDMRAIAASNAEVLELQAAGRALEILAGASRRTPRVLNNLMKTASILAAADRVLDDAVAREVLDATATTFDGLSYDMQNVLTFLLTKGRHVMGDGSVRYQAGLNTLATATGHSRDSKAVALRIEPFLIETGFLQVTPSGRRLTDAGVERATELQRRA